MTARYLRLQLRAFNGECDAIISKVTYRNLESSRSRVDRAFDAINKLGEPHRCRIQPAFRDLKFQELRIAHDYAELKQEEKEEQRRIRQQMREEEQAARELQRARQEAEAEEILRMESLAQARRDYEAAQGEERSQLTARIAELETQLADAHARAERAKSMAEQTKLGHVYVVSNVGAFGERVFKIGMTRRLDPAERVKELGDASVPFPFDVHAMVFSENAPAMEAELHQRFDDRRMNLVNRRKEFFHVEVDELAIAVSEIGGEITFTKKAEASEYYRTRLLREEQLSTDDEMDELRVI